MSSNIRITRICQCCAKEFEARTTVTKYCSEVCNKKHYKQKLKQQKINASHTETTTLKEKPLEEIKSKEFLTVKDVARLLNSSRQTIYTLIKSGQLMAVNIKIKKSLIKRSEIDKIFNQAPVTPIESTTKPKVLKVEDCYSIGEAERLTGFSNKALYEIIKRNNIPKMQQGKFVYIPKAAVNKFIKPLSDL